MGMHDPAHICLNCGHQGSPKDISKGTFITELSFWVVTAIIAASSTWALLIAPLAFTIYRATNKVAVCELCNSKEIIPADSPKGKSLIDAKQSN